MLPDCLMNVCQRKIFYGELHVGKRSHAGQKKRYKDTLKASLKGFKHTNRVGGTDCTGSNKVARPHGEYEAKRISEAKQKRAQRKARAKASPTELSPSDLSCSIGNRQFGAKIGLISHLRTHK